MFFTRKWKHRTKAGLLHLFVIEEDTLKFCILLLFYLTLLMHWKLEIVCISQFRHLLYRVQNQSFFFYLQHSCQGFYIHCVQSKWLWYLKAMDNQALLCFQIFPACKPFTFCESEGQLVWISCSSVWLERSFYAKLNSWGKYMKIRIKIRKKKEISLI